MNEKQAQAVLLIMEGYWPREMTVPAKALWIDYLIGKRSHELSIATVKKLTLTKTYFPSIAEFEAVYVPESEKLRTISRPSLPSGEKYATREQTRQWVGNIKESLTAIGNGTRGHYHKTLDDYRDCDPCPAVSNPLSGHTSPTPRNCLLCQQLFTRAELGLPEYESYVDGPVDQGFQDSET